MTTIADAGSSIDGVAFWEIMLALLIGVAAFGVGGLIGRSDLLWRLTHRRSICHRCGRRTAPHGSWLPCNDCTTPQEFETMYQRIRAALTDLDDERKP